MKAKEMFKELGYKKTYDGEYSIVYTKEENEYDRYEIEFFKMLNPKQIKCTFFYENEYEEEIEKPYYIDINELQAIIKQCEELGWS